DPIGVYEIQRFRRELFVERCGWDLEVEGKREVDQFDTPAAIHCAVRHEQRIRGTFRAIPTTEPYLAAVVFPQLAQIRAYPRRADMIEISRFGVWPDALDRPISFETYAAMFRLALDRHATALVAIVDVQHERHLRALGIRTRRYGPPQTVGSTTDGRPIVAVAGEIPMTDQVSRGFDELMARAKRMEVANAVDPVFRRAAVSA
ncbi:MAG: GNAT family N-acetyltransferase, partial [Rhizobiales bacterium]|nr:GNAT family N-acetyltransferase [Hyphomicrobiales bacterium]